MMDSCELYQPIYRELKERILYGKYPHNFHLVVGALSEELKVGAAVIRRALAALQEDHLVCNYPSKGFFVYCPDKHENLLYLRNELESAAITQVVFRADQARLEELSGLALAADRAKSDHDLVQYVNSEMDFHCFLVECSENAFLIEMHTRVRPLLKQYLSNYYEQLHHQYRHLDDVRQVMGHHLVVESIRMSQKNGSPEAAVRAMELHLIPVYGAVEALRNTFPAKGPGS